MNTQNRASEHPLYGSAQSLNISRRGERQGAGTGVIIMVPLTATPGIGADLRRSRAALLPNRRRRATRSVVAGK